MQLHRHLLAAVIVAFSSADCLADEFPDGAKAPVASELKSLMSGKTFDVKLSGDRSWRFQVNDNGYFFLNIFPGNYSDSGEWKMEDGKFCTKPQKSNASCNEMRLVGDALFMKRDNGQVVQFVPRQ